MPSSVIVYGPQGCGKTRNAERIKKILGLKRIVDGWPEGEEKRLESTDVLYLTNLDAEQIAAATMGKFISIRAYRNIHLPEEKAPNVIRPKQASV